MRRGGTRSLRALGALLCLLTPCVGYSPVGDREGRALVGPSFLHSLRGNVLSKGVQSQSSPPWTPIYQDGLHG